MDKTYDHTKYESEIYKMWEKGGYFTPKIDRKKKPFSIILPLPNANDPMHIGHAMFVTVEGGLHGDTNLNIQEFMVVPTALTIAESVRVASAIFNSLLSTTSGFPRLFARAVKTPGEKGFLSDIRGIKRDCFKNILFLK